MRIKLLLGLGLSLATAIFAACGDPGDASAPGDDDEGMGLEDGGAAQGEGGVDEGSGSGPFGGVGDLGGGSSSRSRAARAALAMGGAFDVATLEALARGRAIPFVTATNGTVIGSTISPLGAVTAGKYSAYLDLTGFADTTSATPSLAGLIIRVNSGTTAPVTGCGTAGNFDSGNSDQGTVATATTSFVGGDFNIATGAGSVRINGLTIASGTTAPYAVRICSKDSTGTVGLGTAYTFNVTTDITKPADGDIGTTLATSTVVTAAISGFTDDRAIDHLNVRVTAGLVYPTTGCTGTATSTIPEIPVTVASSSLAAAGIVGAVPYISPSALSTGGTLTVTVPGITVGNRYSMRICAVDVAGNTAAGATGRVTVKATSAIPASPTFTSITSASTETIFNTTSVQATTAAYAAATLTVQCPNPAATAAMSDRELGTFTRTSPPFTANATCTMEPTVVCSGPRCTATSVGVTDLCPRSGKKLGLAITCNVATAASSTAEVVGISTLDSLNASVPAALVVTCPNPADTISALTVDYGDPSVTAAGVLTANPACTSSAATTPPTGYATAVTNLNTACIGQRSCTVRQGLAATAIVPSFTTPTALDCPARMTTAAVFTCTQTYMTSPAVTLDIDGTPVAAGSEICISNTPITSAGATALTRGDCGTGWLPLQGAGDVSGALNGGTHTWTLSGGDGLKTVYFKVHDAAFNESAVVTRQVRMDTIAPVRQGMLARADNLTSLPLTNRIYWNRFTESGSGIASYKLVYTSNGILPPTDCSDTSPTSTVKIIGVGSVGTRGWTMNAGATSALRTADEPPTAQVPFFHNEEYSAAGAPLGTALTPGALYTYRVCATDRAGRSSTLAVSTATVAAGPVVSGTATGVTPVTYAPGATSVCVAAPTYGLPTLTGNFTLLDNGGTAITALGKNWTNSVIVDATHALTPGGTGGAPYEYCFSRSNQAASCTTSMWNAASTTIDSAGNVGGGDGLKTLYAHVRDQYRNVSASPSTISSTIYEDRTVPSTPTFTATSSATAQIELVWTLPTDAGSGLAPVSAPNQTPYKITYSRSASQTTQPVTPAENCVDGPTEAVLTLTAGELVANTTKTLTAATNSIRSGYTYAYRLCVYDAAGNNTVGVVRTIKAD